MLETGRGAFTFALVFDDLCLLEEAELYDSAFEITNQFDEKWALYESLLVELLEPVERDLFQVFKHMLSHLV